MLGRWDLLLFVRKHGYSLFLAAILVLSITARVSGLGFVSDDFTLYLSPWYDEIDSMGKSALAAQVGNYGIPYQMIILVLTYLPIPSLLAYKVVSIVFDYLLAVQCYKLVIRLSKSRLAATLCFGFVLLLPPVVLNSSVWGQCDSIYAFFSVLALNKLFSDKSKEAYWWLGVALAFKLQAIFLVPFFVLHFILSGKYSASRFLYTLLGFYVPSLPGVIARGSLLAPFSIYYGQTTLDPSVAIDFPGFWCMFFNIESSSMFIYSLVLTVAVFAIEAVAVLLMYKREKILPVDYLLLATLSVWTCVEFLPSMHQRYGYVLLVLLTICLFVVKSQRGGVSLLGAAWLVNLVATFVSYSAYLYRMPALTEWFQTAIFVAAVVVFCCWVFFTARVTRWGELRMTWGRKGEESIGLHFSDTE